jgi:hypothetical protein
VAALHGLAWAMVATNQFSLSVQIWRVIITVIMTVSIMTLMIGPGTQTCKESAGHATCSGLNPGTVPGQLVSSCQLGTCVTERVVFSNVGGGPIFKPVKSST